MARKKVKLAYIVNDSARRVTFRKRRNGLRKKASELSTLCGVNTCAIVYGPDDEQPQVWPAPPEAHSVLMRFKSLPEMEQKRKQLNQESFVKKRTEKIMEHWSKLRRDNRYMEINRMCNLALAGEFSIRGVHDHSVIGDLFWLLGEKKKEVQLKLLELKRAPTPVVQTTFDAVTRPNANTTDIPNLSTANVGVGNGGTATGTGMYGGVVNHRHSQGGSILSGTGTFIPQHNDQMLNYLAGGYQNNYNQMMMMGGGGVPPPSYNRGTGTLADIVNCDNARKMPNDINLYVPMNNM